MMETMYTIEVVVENDTSFAIRDIEESRLGWIIPNLCEHVIGFMFCTVTPQPKEADE